MKRVTPIFASLCAWLCVSCISLYSTGTESGYYSDGIYYAPQKATKSVVVVNSTPAPEPVYYTPKIEGYWLGGWDGSEADLRRAYDIIGNYPNGFGYMVSNEASIAESMAFSSDWNVFVSNGRYWWFPTSLNYAIYTDFLFGPYPSADIVFFDYSPYRWRAGVRFGTSIGIGVGISYSVATPWYYNPWYYDPWYYDPWYYGPHHYDPWCYDPWYHHHHHYYDPYYGHHYPGYYPGPHHKPHHPGYYPGPGYRPHRPEHTRPHNPTGPNKPGHSPKPEPGHRPNQGKWRPTTTPGGGQTITPGTTQRPGVGGGVVGGNGAPDNKKDQIVRPGTTNGRPNGTRVDNNRPTQNNGNSRVESSRPTQNGSGTTTVTRPGKSNSNKVARPTGNSSTSRVTRPSNNSSSSRVTRPTNSGSSRVTRPSNSGSYRSGTPTRSGGSSISRPTGGGASRNVGGGGGRISRTR
ncbi:MAG: hypothetical protein J6K74_05685 [Marinifilaceae bacterium]|nr:hypothetical protein [Marinifilaceae bacterium]